MSYKGYTHPELLFTPQDLQKRIHDKNIVIIDTRETHEFAVGHIPNAVHWDLYGISLVDTSPAPFAAFMAMFALLLGNRGVTLDKTVVFYENDSGMRAARGYWFTEYFGHKDVHVLDGGLNAYVKAGYETTTACIKPEHVAFKIAPVPHTFISANEMRDALGQKDFVPMDTRSAGEYYGRIVRAARGGAIPGAKHIEYIDNLDQTGAYKSADQLKAMYEPLSVTPDKTIACYCQGGYRSAHTYLALRLLGYPNVRNYIGSWKEWGDRPDLPIETPKES